MSSASSLLKSVFGYSTFRGKQAEIVDHVIDGGDCLVLMPTGGGKSLCYQIPALARRAQGKGTAIVVSPLIALMQDQVAALTEAGVNAAYLNSTLSSDEAQRIEKALLNGTLDLLYVAPERLMTPRFLALLERAAVCLFAIDEAHCVSQWGHDFRPEYIQLSVLHERFPNVPRMALTATADAITRDEIIARLALQDARVFIDSFDRPNIRYAIIEKDNARQQFLRFLKESHTHKYGTDAGIVYCLSRRKVEETAEWLVQQGVQALPYHAGMDTATRARHQERFRREEGIVMVATIAFGMGIDKPDVRFVAHLDLPKSIEGYYQETGRAGRDGLPANAWMAYGLADVVQQRRMIDESEADISYKRVSTAKLDALLGLCETAGCRRVALLSYFGETAAPCGNCDTCLSPPATWDGSREAQMALSCVYRVRQMNDIGFGAGHLIDILRGNTNPRVTQWRHGELSTFGIGKDLSETAWRGIFRQLVAQGILAVDHGSHGALVLTETARPILRGEIQVTLRRERAQKDKALCGKGSASSATAATLDGEAQQRWQALREWRAATAREHNIPAYVIFHDATLLRIAEAVPETLTALGELSGVGATKLERYGEALLGVLRAAESVPER